MTWQDVYTHRFYRGREGWIDGTEQFHRLCGRYLTPASRVLEIGAGPSNPTSQYLSEQAAEVVGLDIDEAVKGNEFLAEAFVYDGGAFPFADARFDIIVSDYVLEHVEFPERLFQEASRVLAPGGAFLFRTPTSVHYVSLLSRIFPDSLSRWARSADGRERETYPKYYRCNSERVCRRYLEHAGLTVESMEFIEKEPSYGMRSRLLFLPMVAYERLVNATDLLKCLRANILCSARKEAPAP